MRLVIGFAIVAAASAAHAESRRFLDRPATMPAGGWRAGLDVRAGGDAGLPALRVGLDAGLPLALEAQGGVVLDPAAPRVEVAAVAAVAGGGLLDLTARAAASRGLGGGAWTTALGVEAQLAIGPIALIAGGDELTFDVAPDLAGRAADATLGFPVGVAAQLGPIYARADAGVRLHLRYDGAMTRDGTAVAPAALTAIAGVGRRLDVVARVEAAEGFDHTSATVGIRYRGGR